VFARALIRCPLCRRRAALEEGCCAACREGLFEPWGDREHAFLGVYQGRLELAVEAYKFRSATRLTELFAPALAAVVAERGWGLELVCAVPLHASRERGRGFNQAELLARAVAAHLKLPYRAVLARTRKTRQQAKLGGEARFQNVQGAFVCHPLRSERVLLVDDVVTSGATTLACTQALRAAGARSVRVAAVAGPKGG
jgi:ComF family protein